MAVDEGVDVLGESRQEYALFTYDAAVSMSVSYRVTNAFIEANLFPSFSSSMALAACNFSSSMFSL